MARLGTGCWALVALLGFVSQSASGAEVVDSTPSIQSYLAAGEFGPARSLATSTEDRASRDAYLATIAAEQARIGSRNSSLATIGLMRDDRSRAAALGSLSESPNRSRGAQGGVEADFDGLMDLITSTIAPTTWDEVGGLGSIAPFETGVRVDADGVLKKIERKASPRLATLLADARSDRAPAKEFGSTDPRRASQLRKVSLPRLERAIQLSLAAGKPPTEAMRVMAGLEKVRYVLIYPDSGDVVLAGPAGDWKPSVEGRIVSATSGRPVVQLDDFVVIWRHFAEKSNATFGCAITPTQDSLARTKAFVEASTRKPLKPGGRDAWLTKLREQLGRQEIDVYGIDPRTRVAQVLVEADYRMKLVGMGLEEGTVGVTSYLDSIELGPNEAPPPMDVLRWWFTMNYQSLVSTPDHDGFELRGQGVQVQSENEMISRQGERIHTGKSSALNQQFSQSFTEHFATLAKKYPVYADMQNLFDLALVVALIRNEQLADRADWHALCFGDSSKCAVGLGVAPKEVDTVMNHRVVNEKHIIVGVSGGVRVDPWPVVAKKAMTVDSYGKLKAERTTGAAPTDLDVERWWWD